MLIALDYDQTYTTDPALWDEFINRCISRGHEVICITLRYPKEAIADLPIPIHYTSRKAKSDFCKVNSIKVDIWIDDKPAYIFEDHISIL